MVNVTHQYFDGVVSPALMKPFGSGATDFSAPGWGVCCGPSCEGCAARAARGVAWASAVHGGCRAAATDSSLGRPERRRARNWTVWGLVFLKKQKPLMLSSYFLALTPTWVMNCFQQHDKPFTRKHEIHGYISNVRFWFSKQKHSSPSGNHSYSEENPANS